MLDIKKIQSYRKKYNIPLEDLLFLDMNISGLKANEELFRIRFLLKFNNDLAEMYDVSREDAVDKHYFALHVNPKSKYQIIDNKLYYDNNILLGNVDGFTVDHCDSSYMRKKGKVLSINVNSKSKCSGCKFCYTNNQTPNDADILCKEDTLREYLDSKMVELKVNDLSCLEQVSIVTGCFNSNQELINFLLMLDEVLKVYGFQGKIFYLGSQIKTNEEIHQVAKIKNFSYCISIECFERRNELLNPTKRSLDLDTIKNIMIESRNSGISVSYSYIIGLEKLEIVEKYFKEFKNYVDEFPTINIFQQHLKHEEIREEYANNIEYYIEARKIIEKIYKDTKHRPKSWENYRSLWQFKFNNEKIKQYI